MIPSHHDICHGARICLEPRHFSPSPATRRGHRLVQDGTLTFDGRTVGNPPSRTISLFHGVRLEAGAVFSQGPHEPTIPKAGVTQASGGGFPPAGWRRRDRCFCLTPRTFSQTPTPLLGTPAAVEAALPDGQGGRTGIPSIGGSDRSWCALGKATRQSRTGRGQKNERKPLEISPLSESEHGIWPRKRCRTRNPPTFRIFLWAGDSSIVRPSTASCQRRPPAVVIG